MKRLFYFARKRIILYVGKAFIVKGPLGHDSCHMNHYNLHKDFRHYNLCLQNGGKEICGLKRFGPVIFSAQLSFQHHFHQWKNFLIMLRIRQKLLFGQTLRESIKLIFGAQIKRFISNLRSKREIGRVLSDTSVLMDREKYDNMYLKVTNLN